MGLNLVTAPTVEPLTAAEARARLNLGSEVPDAVMNAFISAARQMIDGADGWLGRAINTQTWDLVVNQFQGHAPPLEKGFYPRQYRDCGDRPYGQSAGIPILLPPLQSVTSVKYLDTDGAQQTLDPATYVVQSGTPSHLVLANGASWPSISTLPGSVTIRFIAGYGPKGSDVPETIRTAVALQASYLRTLGKGDLFLSREEIPGVSSKSWTMGGGAELALNAAVMALLGNLRVWV